MLLDIVFAWRQIRKRPGFTAVILMTLALCIGANVAIFSMVYTLLLKPLPYPDPSRIVEIYNTFPKAGFDKMPSNVVQYDDYKRNAASFSKVGLMALDTHMIGEEGHAERVGGAYCTADMFEILGLKPVIGQFFTLKNSVPGSEKVIVLTQSYWESHYRSDPGVIGQTIRFADEPYQIIGVAPRAIESMDARIHYLHPMTWTPADLNPIMRFSLGTSLYARLKAGVSPAQALEEAKAIEKRYYDTIDPVMRNFLDRAGHRIAVGVLQDEKVRPVRSSMLLIEAGVAFVLVIGCVNIANLLLARANNRQGEIAVRSALGASRWAIARQLLVECIILTFSGGVLGMGLAYTLVRIMNVYSAKMMPDMLAFSVDGRALSYAVALAVGVGILIGLFPVFHTLRLNLAAQINRGSRSVSGHKGVRSLSSVLVVAQVAVALVLLVGAGLLVHSFENALAVKPGFDPDNITVGRIALPRTYSDVERNAAFQQKFLQALREIPGAEDAALSNGIPFEGGIGILAATIKENDLPKDSPQPGAFLVGSSTGYFQAMHIQLVAGRFLDDRDSLKGARTVYVVDERFAQRYFPHRPAVGSHFSFNGPQKNDADWPEIVGVVRNVPHNGVADISNTPFIYYPILRTSPGELCFFVRSHRPVGDTLAAVRNALGKIDPGVAIFDTGSLHSAIASTYDNRRAVMLLLVGFAGLALFLSAIGIYGVLAYDISQRTREIGVRGAIGASRSQIVRMILLQGLVKAAVGLAIGLVSASFLSRLMQSQNLLYDTKPTDPISYIAVSVALLLTATLASFLPARMASSIEPIEALRSE